MSFEHGNHHKSIISYPDSSSSSSPPPSESPLPEQNNLEETEIFMDPNNNRPTSPVTRVYSELQRLLTSAQCDQIFPLINSAVANEINTSSDEVIAREYQDQLYDNSMDVDPPIAAAMASFDTRTSEEIDADAAYALQLQEEEYSRNSIMPTRSYPRKPNNNRFSSSGTTPNPRLQLTDEEFAAQLQEEENKIPQRHQQRPRVQFQRRIPPPQRPTHNDSPENIPFPFLFQPNQQGSRGNRNNFDFSPLFRMITQHNSGANGLETNADDFGPNDYENLLELDNNVDRNGITNDQINRLPTEKFVRPRNKTDEENKCNVCWDQFQPNETLRRLPCLHLYHQKCIDPWLQKNNSCPICRLPAIKE